MLFIFVKKGGGKLANDSNKYTIKTKPYGVIYCVENKINKKKYIGITTRSIKERFKEHCKADSVIGKAIRKYNKENFVCYQLDTAESKEELCELERYYISLHKTFFDGYNLTIGGEGVVVDNSIEVVLNKKQQKFISYVEKENKTKLDVFNLDELLKSIMLNTSYLYLTSETKTDKRQAAKQILKLKENALKNVLDLKLFTLDELRRWERWQNMTTG